MVSSGLFTIKHYVTSRELFYTYVFPFYYLRNRGIHAREINCFYSLSNGTYTYFRQKLQNSLLFTVFYFFITPRYITGSAFLIYIRKKTVLALVGHPLILHS